MLRLLRNKKAQNTAEYAILIALIIGVFAAMQIYIRRGMQARIKAGTDNIPDLVLDHTGEDKAKVDGLFGDNTQYEPYYIRGGAYSMDTTTSEGTERGAISEAGATRDLTGATSTRVGSQQILGAEEDVEE